MMMAVSPKTPTVIAGTLTVTIKVPSASWHGGVVKFYLMRHDPSILADSTNMHN
jgi:hypothetical protein